jgi:hypothetical protein
MQTKFTKLIAKIINFFLPKSTITKSVSEEEVREKIKQLKYQHLKRMFHKHLSKYPENCKYNKVVILPNRNQINICTFNLEDTVNVDLCYKIEHSKDCNAFCPILNKDQIKDIFLEELSDPQKRATHYKDINILYWLYPDLIEEKIPLEETNFLKKIWKAIIK